MPTACLLRPNGTLLETHYREGESGHVCRSAYSQLFSDGAQTPEQAALACRDSGVGLAALCDHNSWLGCERFAAACEDLGVQSIRGAEFDCRWQGYHLHILGYGFTPTPQLAAIAHRSRELLLQMSVDLIEKWSRNTRS